MPLELNELQEVESVEPHNLHELAVTQIRKMILSGVFGTKRIRSAVIQEHLKGTKRGMSGSIRSASIRRALNELEQEELVTIEPKSGTFVRQFTAPEVSQLWNARAVLEDLIVCTLARSGKVTTNRQIDDAVRINERLASLAQCDDGGEDNITDDPIELDMLFHDCLAEAAGYKVLQKQLRTVRYQLRLAAGPVELTSAHIREMSADHTTIIEAIRPRHSSLMGDVVNARLAMRSHLRHAAIRMKFEDRLISHSEYRTHPVLDMPPAVIAGKSEDALPLSVLRVLIELFVAAQISKQDIQGRLSNLANTLSRMKKLADKHSGPFGTAMNDDDKALFVNLDIIFHSTLALISGLTFAEEAIMHFWQRMYNDAERSLSGDQMERICNEHEKILKAIQYFSNNPDEPQGTKSILAFVRQHFIAAYGRARRAIDPSLGEAESQLLPKPVGEFISWFCDHLADEPSADVS